MSNLIAIFVVFALLILFPAFLFVLLVRAIRIPGTRWWGIVVLLSLLTCYCTSVVGVAGMIVGGNATGTAALERRYCGEFREALTKTATLPEAIERMDAASAADDYQVREPEKNLRFRYVWLLGGCFLFAGANLMMFAPGRREKRHPADCLVMITAALVVFLTGIWQIAWGNGYAYQAASYRRFLTGWHEGIQLDAIRATNAEIAAKLTGDGIRNLNELRRMFRELSGERMPGGVQVKTGKAGVDGSGVAIIGGADGPTAVFINSELAKKQGGAPIDENEEKADSQTGNAVPDL